MKLMRDVRMILAAAAVVATGLFAGCGGGDGSPSSPSGGAVLRGRLLRGAGALAVVRDAAPGSPIAGAEVLLDGQPTGVVTDANGEFTLTLPPGPHTISADVGGTVTGSLTFAVDGVADVTVEFELQPDGKLTTHDDVNDDGKIDDGDDIDDDGDIDDDDADGDIEDDGEIDVGDDSSDNGDDDSSGNGDDNSDGSDDKPDDGGDDSPDDGSDDSPDGGDDDSPDGANDNP